MNDVEQGMNRFINEQRIQFPALTNFDITNLKIGFAEGVKYQIRVGLEENLAILKKEVANG